MTEVHYETTENLNGNDSIVGDLGASNKSFDATVISTFQDDAGDQHDIVTLKKRTGTNGVWDYFSLAKKTYPTDEEIETHTQFKIICDLCFKDERIQIYKKTTSSSNLWAHLRKKHQIETPTCASGTGGSANRPKTKLKIKKQRNSSETNLSASKEQEEDSDMDFDEQNTAVVSGVADINFILIEEVAKRPLIYGGHGVGNKELRDKEWEDLGTVFKGVLPLDQLKKNWKNIRDRYQKIRKLQERGICKNPKYKYYPLLEFLDEIKRTPKRFKEEDTSDESSNEPVLKKLCIESYKADEASLNGFEDQNRTEDDFTDSFIEHVPDDPLLNQIQFNAANNPTSDKDEYDIFGCFIAEKLRRMQPNDASRMEMKLIALLSFNT